VGKVTARTVAVVPFGARGGTPATGAWARQIARRLVDRFAADDGLELRPVFLVALSGTATEAGYLVFGSTPDPALAASYGASLGTTHVLTGELIDEPTGGRRIAATLVTVGTATTLAVLEQPLPPGALATAEPALARWLATQLGRTPPADSGAPLPAEQAYAQLLEGLDEEVNETLLRPTDPSRADLARDRATQHHLAALAADPACAAAEEWILARAAGSLERGDVAPWIKTLEEATGVLPRSWRAQYLLGELRRQQGDAAGAIVALEHADALRPLSDADALRLALLYRDQAAPRVAAARLRRIRPDSSVYAEARAALAVLSAEDGDLAAAIAEGERAIAAGARDGALYARLAQWQLETGDAAAAAAIFARSDRATPSWELALAHAVWLHRSGDLAAAGERYREAIAAGAPAVARLDLARALVTAGDQGGAAGELERLLAAEPAGELAAHARRLLLGLRDPQSERRLEAAGAAAVSGPDSGLAAAGEELAAIIAAVPDLWEAEFGAGLVARRRGDADASERHFRRVLELWPEQPDALHELGVALLMADKTNEAVRALETAARLRPDDAGYLADAGFAHLRAGNLRTARERLTLARERNGADPITRAYLEELVRVEAAVGTVS
jgi:tetratricopeptide (TPR) repeat protein